MHRSWIAWRNGGSKQLMMVFNQKKAAEWQSLAKRKQFGNDIGIIPSTPSVPIQYGFLLPGMLPRVAFHGFR
jgi:hypothetical protein